MHFFIISVSLFFMTCSIQALETFEDGNKYIDLPASRNQEFEHRFEEIKSFDAVKSTFLYLLNKRDLLVVIDLDESLVHLENLALMHWTILKQWFGPELYQALGHLDMSDTQFGNLREEYIRISSDSWKRYKLVEPESANIIKEIQKSGGTVIAITALPLEYPDPRIQALVGMGVDFSKNIPVAAGPKIKKMVNTDDNTTKATYGISSGVYSAHGTTKAKVVLEVLKKLNAARDTTLDSHYKTLIAVDDNIQTLELYQKEFPQSMNLYIFEYLFFRHNVTTQHILHGINEILVVVEKHKKQLLDN